MTPSLMNPVLNRPTPAAPTAQQPLVRLVTLPGLGTVQLQQIQTPNGPAFLAVQQQQPQQVIHLIIYMLITRNHFLIIQIHSAY